MEDIDLETIAMAVVEERATLDAVCGPDPEMGGSWTGQRERALRRAKHSELREPFLLEETLWTLRVEVHELQQRWDACGLPPPEVAQVYVLPTVPSCVARDAAWELEAATALASWGYADAADAFAEATLRFLDTRCARRDPRGREPVSCSCGGQSTPPIPYVHGHILGPWPEFELDLWAPGECVVPLRGPIGTCPIICEAERLAREGGRRARRVDRGMFVHGSQGPFELFSVEDGPVTEESLRSFVEEAVSCGSGAAEWAGGWFPWSSSAADTCIAQLAARHLAPRRWMMVVHH